MISNYITFRLVKNNYLFYRNILKINSCRYYSTNNGNTKSQSDIKPIPILTLGNLNKEDSIKSYREIFKNKGGIYSFINTLNNKKYIGSAKDLYLRFVEHIFFMV